MIYDMDCLNFSNHFVIAVAFLSLVSSGDQGTKSNPKQDNRNNSTKPESDPSSNLVEDLGKEVPKVTIQLLVTEAWGLLKTYFPSSIFSRVWAGFLQFVKLSAVPAFITTADRLAKMSITHALLMVVILLQVWIIVSNLTKRSGK